MSGDGDIGFVFHERFLQHDTGPAVVGSPPQPYPYLAPEAHVEPLGGWGESKSCSTRRG
jgi:hypothetical protein